MHQIGSHKWLLMLTVLLIQHHEVQNGFACLSNPCVHGVCLDDLNSTYFCYCIDGYTGIQCQTNWNECWSSPCRNGGVCIDGIAMFNCSCPPGYSGKLCEDDINECESNPCQNNGTCLDERNGYTCNCLAGYSGTYCEIDVAVCNATGETRCANGGVCEEGPGETFTCKCQKGWGGFLCDWEIDECVSAPCQNGAICIDLHADYSCACLFGFAGRNCEETMQICDESPCKNGALCIYENDQPICYCVPDFHGDLCQFQYDECQLGPRCMNAGSCIDGVDNFTCSCPPNLTGVLCECLILSNGSLDCDYVSPEPSAYPTTTTSYYNLTISSTSVTSTTTEVPITETTIMTVFPNTSIGIVSTSSTNIPSSTATDNETNLSTTFSSTYPISTTDFFTSTTEVSTLSAAVTYFTELTTIYESTTSSSIEYPVYSTEFQFETSSSTIYSNITYSSTFPAEVSSAPMLSTTEYTTELDSGSTLSTTLKYQPSNRSISEETTTYTTTFLTAEPTTTTFLTTEPNIKFETSTGITTSSTVASTMLSSTQETTTFVSIDCTNSETRCLNGGTCIYVDGNYKCICNFDYEGEFCESKLGVKRAAFGGNSFLSHRLHVTSYHIVIEFEAKTMANDGIIFFANVNSPHMVLYMKNGFLKFIFSCGYQTMLLSELKVPVNNGYNMNIKAGLDFREDLKHCNASIKINDSLSMTGDQIAKIIDFPKGSAWLHVGGLPQYLAMEIGLPVGGFVGCMANLKIGNRTVKIYDDAEDGYEVTECSSLACLSNPCRNDAFCSSVGDEWQCHCRNGYLGKSCEVSICDDNPCLFGGTCIPFTNSGYICLCPYGKHGHFCENDIKITQPYFSSSVHGLSSFVAYPFPDGISKTMEIKFRFAPTTMEQISILLFIGQAGHHDFYSDHIAVSFVRGYIMLTWNLGSGPRRIFTSQSIKPGATDYLVKLGHTGRRAWLYVEHLGNVTGRSPGNLVQLDVVPLLYVGGFDVRNFSTLPHDLPLHTGFSGCIYDIEMKSGSVVIPFQGSMKAFGRAVGQCGTSECHERSCQNGGACLHHGSTFMCLCQDEWFGPLCSSRFNLCDGNITKCSENSRCVPLLSHSECDCPFGRVGTTCEKIENITDVSLTGIRSFIKLNPMEIEGNKFHIEFEIRILKDHGIVIFMGTKDVRFICLSLQNGLLEFKIQTGSSKISSTGIVIRSSILLIKGVWHKIQFGRFGKKVYLSVDKTVNTGVLDTIYTPNFNKETIYIGGLPDMSHLPLFAASGVPVHFKGCIRHLSIDTTAVPLTADNVRQSRNLIDCDGTPCGGEACYNGGTCWLDSFMNPHCSCPVPYYGEKCENVKVCNERTCKNRGICINNRCTCQVGWSGAFCEYEIAVNNPKFNGRSYLIMRKVGDRKRELKEGVRRIFLNFTTVNPNGLLFWNKKGGDHLGLGLENGFLKVVIASEKMKQNILEVPSYTKVTDGLWHKLDLNIDLLNLTIDDKVIAIRKAPRYSQFYPSGNFFIGGIPNVTNLITETDGVFTHNFEGCIASFGTNLDVITDFSHMEGLNIDTCEVLAH
ncbi:protein eyes shut [Diorhabda sublineata]|uniref:protein eyes shut n=1 Tax=Diorhabda sublineata TaxID=1163346 RepID=UPI0024E12287|nr:protein eyes shut [Diorhabda sublineata]